VKSLVEPAAEMLHLPTRIDVAPPRDAPGTRMCATVANPILGHPASVNVLLSATDCWEAS
jgi:hypothetical protein